MRDSLSTAGLPYASITAEPGNASTVADNRGLFEMNLPAGARTITARYQGYAPRTVPVKHSAINLYDIYLTPQAEELKEVVIKRKRYSKRNNPAVDFARRIRNARELTDPRRNDFYSYDRYERTTLALNDFDTTASNALLKSMPFLIEHVDTSLISGQPVLNLSLKEKASTEYWQKDGERSSSVVRGTRNSGIDEFVNQNNVTAVLDNFFREIDLYEGNIKMLNNSFVSPLSPVAPDFYRFYLTDSAAVVPGSDKPHIALAFYPQNKSYFGFSGHIYVERDDTTMFITRVEMKAPKEMNLNFIKDLSIVQTFDRAPDGSRLKTADDLMMVLYAVNGLPDFYVTHRITNRNHSFARPADADSIFSTPQEKLVRPDAAERDSVFWTAEAARPLPKGENKTHELMKRLRGKPLVYWGEKVLHALTENYIPIGRNSKFDPGPISSLASYNSLEGLRLRAGGMTTANLSRHWFGRGYVAHGFKDHRWKYGAEVEYSFTPKEYHSREFPMHSLRLTHSYDIDRLGSRYLHTSSDNAVLSLQRMSDAHFSYLRQTVLRYTLELRCNFSIVAEAAQRQQNESRYLRFELPDGTFLPHYNMTEFGITLSYAPGARYLQGRNERSFVDTEVPVFTLSHRYAPKGVLGSRYGLNRTELSVSKQFDLYIAGRLYLDVNAAHVWGSSPFTELLIPNANLSYTIQRGAFALMNPMEFINTSYVSLHATWQLRGALLNLIPVVRRAGLREVVSFSGLWGHRSHRADPTFANMLPALPADVNVTRMSGRPYMEVSAGLDNILKLFRVDYVWRLSYLDVPYPIDRHGIRTALHVTF